MIRLSLGDNRQPLAFIDNNGSEKNYSDEEIKERFIKFYGEDTFFPPERIPYFREKWSSLSEFIREIKQTFSRYYNKFHNRRGTLWGEKFKSVIVQDGVSLLNCLAYIDLNPIRAGIVKKERNKNFEITSPERFINNTRYFSDSGIIGSKKFVAENYQRFKHMFQLKNEKKPKSVKGIDGLYSLKRLSS